MLNPLNFLSKIIKSNNQKELDKLKKAAKKLMIGKKKLLNWMTNLFQKKPKN